MKLAYGVSSVEIPDDCQAAIGFRAILRDGHIEVVHDRVARHATTHEGYDALLAWYGTQGMAWLDELAKCLRGNDPNIYDDNVGPIHIRASAQASYGYLYVTMWVGAS